MIFAPLYFLSRAKLRRDTPNFCYVKHPIKAMGIKRRKKKKNKNPNDKKRKREGEGTSDAGSQYR